MDLKHVCGKFVYSLEDFKNLIDETDIKCSISTGELEQNFSNYIHVPSTQNIKTLQVKVFSFLEKLMIRIKRLIRIGPVFPIPILMGFLNK